MTVIECPSLIRPLASSIFSLSTSWEQQYSCCTSLPLMEPTTHMVFSPDPNLNPVTRKESLYIDSSS